MTKGEAYMMTTSTTSHQLVSGPGVNQDHQGSSGSGSCRSSPCKLHSPHGDSEKPVKDLSRLRVKPTYSACR